MEGDIVPQRLRAGLLAIAVSLLAAGCRSGAARPIRPTRRSSSGRWPGAPDARSVDIDSASCPERWSVIAASVRVSQGQTSGEAPFSFPCTGGLQLLTVTVPSSGAAFQLADAQAAASVSIRKGRTLGHEAPQSFESCRTSSSAWPTSLPSLTEAPRRSLTSPSRAQPARRHSSQQALTQGPTTGQGTFMPVCDGQQHLQRQRPAEPGAVPEQLRPGQRVRHRRARGDLIFGEDNRFVLIGGCC